MPTPSAFLPPTELRLHQALVTWIDTRELAQPILTPEETGDLLARDDSFAMWARMHWAKQPDTKATIEQWLSCNLFETLLRCTELKDSTLQQAAHGALRSKLLTLQFAKQLAASKREMLYHLAYGLSHEINNPLANISTRAQMLLNSNISLKDKQALSTIIEQAHRAHEMIGDLMQCAKQPDIHLEWFDANGLVNQVLANAPTSLITPAIQIVPRLPTAPVQVLSDRALLHEVLDILYCNALEAIRQGGTLVVELNSSADSIEVSFIDSGIGLSIEARRHALDPFYSGREAGRGLGMGLCKANHFINALGGHLELNSQPQSGCRASAIIPLQLSRP